jgi:signal transduction histidine kinase
VVILLELLAVTIPAALVLLADSGPFAWSLPTALAACALLPLRRRWPAMSLLACLPALAGGLGWPATVVALYRIGRTSTVPLMIFWVALCTAVASTIVVVTQDLTFGSVLLTYAFATFMSGAPTALGALITTRQHLTRSLSEASRARTAELEAHEEVARASERARIAREIHDAVGHHATLIAVESAALAAVTSEENTRAVAQRLRALAKEALSEMRAALGLLNTEPTQGHEGIPALINRARAAGLPVTFTDQTTSRLPPSIGRAAFRVVQEALTNVTKHAPGSTVAVTLTASDGQLQVRVTNTAPNTRPTSDPGGKGLHGLSERLHLAGGTLDTRQSSDGGFALTATLPTGWSKVDKDDSTFGGTTPNRANA